MPDGGDPRLQAGRAAGGVSTVVIVGAGLAGARCAETLRADGFDGRIVLVGAEPYLPYERPALSKSFLARRKAALALRPREFWDARGIELRLGRPVHRIDVRDRIAYVGDGALRWDQLVLATGARARRIDGPVLHLRTFDDARRLRVRLRAGRRLVVVGAGFVGLEVASTALELGVDVAVIDPAPTPLTRVVGSEVGTLLATRALELGIELHLGVGVKRVTAGDVELADGTALHADVVVAGIGAEPAGDLVGGGALAVDAHGRAQTHGVYACGDVASWHRPSLARHVRAEHWVSAAGQGQTVARTIMGGGDAFDESGYFWSDQLGMRLQRVGDDEPWHFVALEGDEHSFVARYFAEDGRLVAALAANRPHEIAPLRRALAA